MDSLRGIAAFCLVVGCAAVSMTTHAASQKLPAPVDREIDFLKDVEPILAARCYECHGRDVVMNGYSMWRRKDAVRGGYSGLPAIESGESESSRLIRLVAGLEEGLEMPPTGGRLPDEEIGILRAWIDQGVEWDASVEDLAITESTEWLDMDYGSVISASITVREPEDPRADKTAEDNVSYKAHAVSLTPDDRAGIVFDTELLRYAVGWTGGFLKLSGTVFDWKHGPHPWVDGEPVFETPVGPGWARDGRFVDPRPDGFGNLPADWARYRGYSVHGDRIVFSYSIGDVAVLDLPGFESADGLEIMTRTLEVEPHGQEMRLQVAEAPGSPRLLDVASFERGAGPANETIVEAGSLLVGLVGAGDARWHLDGQQIRLRLPPSDETRRWTLFLTTGAEPERLAAVLREAPAPPSLASLTRGGPSRFPESVTTRGRRGEGPGPYVVDEITLPNDNPWHSWMRPGDFAFFEDEDRAVVTTWSGDVWIVDGVDADLEELVWRRYATGFYQPQGAEVVDGTIYVLDRNQITRLHDLNDDGEADFYENFNNDFLATHHFHEFTFDLDRGPDGSFYFAKAARHALPARVDHHGVIMKLDPAGERLEVVCRGFRVPNGVAVGPEGQITTSDQEGHWIPSTPIVMCEPGGYYGYAWGGGIGPSGVDDYDRPITYLPISVDNSGSGQAWVPDARWGPLEGHLVHASYGRGKIFVVLMERIDGVLQGGAVELPVDFGTGLMRPDFRKKDGQLYVTGLRGWGTKKKAAGGFYRVRYEGGPLHMPTGLHVSGTGGISITFTEPLDRASAENIDGYDVRRWNYRRSSRYGSDLFKLDGEQGTEAVTVLGARLSPDGRTVTLEMEDLQEVDQMQISLILKAADGTMVVREISHTVNRLSSGVGEPVLARGEPR